MNACLLMAIVGWGQELKISMLNSQKFSPQDFLYQKMTQKFSKTFLVWLNVRKCFD